MDASWDWKCPAEVSNPGELGINKDRADECICEGKTNCYSKDTKISEA
jgi:hypothetical protein